ncbi:helix-hairpin-helix domain-containing protein [Streptomyces sp. NPDC050617]|uniref:DNA polymerase Y family protein n=1 Tax=Streptomyces sp. NPDC050617 TaxID=3154628 RepID=UPI0034196C00
MTGRGAADEARTGAGAATYREVWGELAARPEPEGERPHEERESGPGGTVSPAADETAPHVLYAHFHRRAPRGTGGPGARPVALGEESYGGLLAMLAEFSPVVEALPPDAALVDVRGARRYFGRDAVGLADLIRLRALALHGVDCTVGAAANPMLARMAAQDGPPGAVRTLADDPAEVAAFLARKPAAALHGVGPATARTLCAYGLDSVGRIAAAPPATLQRILGASAGRRIHERARGIDPTPVTPNAPARSLSAEHRFGGDELDPGRRRRALLTLADGLGSRLRTSGQTARGLALTVRYADGSTTVRARAFEEPTAHTPALTAAAYALHAALGLERARVRAVALRAEDLRDADRTARQLTFDPADDKARRAWAAVDRARARFGAAAVGPAALLDVA